MYLLNAFVLSALVYFGAIIPATLGDDGFTPTGKYDLSPQDIADLCTVVDGVPPPMGNGCVYMKWIPCADNPVENPARPCGWYQQTLCEEGKKSKREIGISDNQNGATLAAGVSDAKNALNIVPYISFPTK